MSRSSYISSKAVVSEYFFKKGTGDTNPADEDLASIERSFKDSCGIVVDIKCPKCKIVECDCRASSPIEIDVKDYMLSSHPQLAQNYSRFLIGGEPNPNGQSYMMSNMHKGFQIIRPTSSYFHRLPQDIKSCQLPNLQTSVEYEIDNKILSVNSEDQNGEILMSYLGTRIDDEGWLMLPDEVYITKAISARISAGFALQEYEIKKTQVAERFWMNMLQYSDKLIAKARSKYRSKDPDQFMNIVLNTVLKRTPSYRDKTSGRLTQDRYQPNNYLLG